MKLIQDETLHGEQKVPMTFSGVEPPSSLVDRARRLPLMN